MFNNKQLRWRPIDKLAAKSSATTARTTLTTAIREVVANGFVVDERNGYNEIIMVAP